jgi:DNA-binding NarL/FixJ family response regulator
MGHVPVSYNDRMARRADVVLLIDDQPFIGELVKRLIGSDPTVELHLCHEPRDAAARARDLAPDAILLDWVMPDVDGLTLLRTLRSAPRTKEARIVVLSGNDDEPARRSAADAGADGFYVKLPARDLLIAAIRGESGEQAWTPADLALDPSVLASYREAPGGAEFTDSLVDQFLREATGLLDAMRAAVRALDADALKRASHRLRGACQSIGANRLAALSAQMEGHAGRTLRGAVAPVLMAEIEQAFRELNDAFVSQRADKR